MIRTDCYLAVLKKFKIQYPLAHFEIVTRATNHCLSPSWQLLQKYKDEGLTFDEYIPIFLYEMERPECQTKIHELANRSQLQDVFLVCYEKSDDQCHRRLLKKLIDEQIYVTPPIH